MDLILNQILFNKLESMRQEPRPKQRRISALLQQLDAAHLALLSIICLLLTTLFSISFIVQPLVWHVCTIVGTLLSTILALLSGLTAVRSWHQKAQEKRKKESKQAYIEQENMELLQSKLQAYMELSKDLATATFDPSCGGIGQYDPVDGNEAVERFASVKQNTQCIFARQSLVWGSKNWDERLSLEENVRASIPMVIKALKIGKHPELMPRGKHVDGFLFEIRGKHYGDTVDHFARTLNRVLTVLSDCDPGKAHVLAEERRHVVQTSSWFFFFASEPIFVTSFAPCYPEKHSRYQFDAPSDSCFIMLQPEFAFMLNKLEPDHAETNWDHPKTSRDRIRLGFRNAGREYWVPNTIYYPASEHVVKSLDAVGPRHPDEIVRWWEMPLSDDYSQEVKQESQQDREH